MSFEKSTFLNPLNCSVDIIAVGNVDKVIDWVEQSTQPIYHPGYKELIPIVGTDWEALYSAPASIEFTEDESQTPDGILYDQKLELFFPGEDGDNTRKDLDYFAGIRWIVKFPTNSGVKKILGNIENPCIAKTSFSSKKGGRLITFMCKSSDRAFLIC